MENLPKALVGVHLLRWIVTYPVDKVIPGGEGGGGEGGSVKLSTL